MQQDVGELVLEGLRVGLGVEVAALPAPAGDGARHAADHLPHRVLALGRTELAPEVLLGDDVGRVLGPAGGELDALLFEGHPLAVADAGVAHLPLDGVERMGLAIGEEAGDLQRPATGCVLRGGGVHGRVHRAFLLCCAGAVTLWK